MKKVRHSVFETNSSSSHSLTLVKGELMRAPFSKEVLRSGTVQVRLGEYGWEWHRYYLPQNKLSYLVTQVTRGDLDNSSTEELREQYPEIERMARVLKEYSGCELEILPSSGYVDDESKGIGINLLASDGALRDFLFSPTSYIQTGNDNYSSPWAIETDKGSDLYYEAFYQVVPADFVLVGRYPCDAFGHGSIWLKSGGYLDEVTCPELLKELRSEAILVNATILQGDPEFAISSYDPLEHPDPKVFAVKEVDSMFGEMPLRVVSNFEAQVRPPNAMPGMHNVRDMPLVLANVAVSPALASKLNALPKTSAFETLLTKAQAQLKQAKQALEKSPKHYYSQRRASTAAAAVAYYREQLKAIGKAAH